MNPLLITPLLELGSRLIDRIFPDETARDAAKLELLKQQQEGAFKELEADMRLAMGQLEVNKAEAESPDWFRGGWRPAVGWVCAAGLGYQFLLRPLLTFSLALNGENIPLPGLEMETLMTLLFGMLGLGAYRTAEKLRGRA